MTRRIVPLVTLAALIPARSTSTPSAGSTIQPGASNASTADGGRDGRGGPGDRGGPGGGRGEQMLLAASR